MARGRSTAIFRVQHAAGTHRTAAKMGRVARELRRIVLDEYRSNAEPRLTAAFQAHAPYDEDERDDIHLRDELEVRIATSGRLRMTVHSPVEGVEGETWDPYPYTDVTRFGHRGTIKVQHRPLLKWRDGDGWHSAVETAGHHPDRDWAADAAIEGDDIAADVASRIGRVVYTRLLP